MRLLRALVIAVMVAAAPAAQANKCPPPAFARALAAADVVFVGRATRSLPNRDAVFAVERVFKGQVPAEVVAHFGGVKYAMLLPPERYLVYGRLEGGRGAALTLRVDACSGSGQAEPLAADLARLGRGKPRARAWRPVTSGLSAARVAPNASAAACTRTAWMPRAAVWRRAPATARDRPARAM
jgi:hypothetical protein